MSNFYCERCHTAILENKNGRYYTECKHYPLSESNILSPNGKGRISHNKLEKIIKYFGDNYEKSQR